MVDGYGVRGAVNPAERLVLALRALRSIEAREHNNPRNQYWRCTVCGRGVSCRCDAEIATSVLDALGVIR